MGQTSEYDAPWWEDAWNGIADFGVGIAQDLAGMVGLYSEEGGWGAGVERVGLQPGRVLGRNPGGPGQPGRFLRRERLGRRLARGVVGQLLHRLDRVRARHRAVAGSGATGPAT